MTDKHQCSHSSSWGSECESEGMAEGEKTTTEKDVTEESASESENISEGEMDDEDAGEES